MVVGGGHQETGTSLQGWAGVVADRRLAAAAEELRQNPAWNWGSGLQEGVGEARASLVEGWGAQERGLAVLGVMAELGFGGAEGCWV